MGDRIKKLRDAPEVVRCTRVKETYFIHRWVSEYIVILTLKVVVGAVAYASVWWGLQIAKTAIEFFPLAWFAAVTGATGYSEWVRILGVRLLWSLDFVWPVFVAAIPVALGIIVWGGRKQYVLALLIGGLCFCGLLATQILILIEPRFVPGWVSYLVMGTSLVFAPLIGVFVTKALIAEKRVAVS